MGRRRQEQEPFADLVRAASSSVPDPPRATEHWPQPIRDGSWIDEDGVRWHLRGRGTELSAPAVRRILRSPDVRVLHAYGPSPREVRGQDRQMLLDRVARYHAGEAPPHSAFWLAEFRNDDRQVMLVVEEAC